MNFRTTYVLAITLLIVVGVFYMASVRRASRDAETGAGDDAALTETGSVERSLIDDSFGDAVKIVCEVNDQPRWVFEAEGATDVDGAQPAGTADAKWKMVEPTSAAVQDWTVRNIASALKRLKYAVVYRAGQEGAVTPAEAGLDPPRATVTLVDKDGNTVSVRLGRDASGSAAYVQFADSDDVFLVNSSLKHVLKGHARDYRKLQLVDFPKDRCVRLELVHRPDGDTLVTYTLVKKGTKWVFESPFRAEAVTAKILDAVSAASRLNASSWVADAADNLGIYGLDAPELIVRATVEETVEPEADEGEDEDEEAAPEPEIESQVHEVRISSLSPLGESTKRYIQKGGDAAVATVLKTALEKLIPNVAEWRDMHVSSADVMGATRIEIAGPGTTAVLERDGITWQFADGAPADAKAVTDLLSQIKQLKAQSFVDDADAASGQAGLDAPEAELALTLPGDTEPERITIGGYADARTKRLRYVRTASNDGIAKVLIHDLGTLLQSPSEYRDRQILEVPAAEVERVAITRPDPLTGDRFEFALSKKDGEWALSQPVEAESESESVKQLVRDLASLRALKTVDAPSGLAAFGLDTPDVTVTLTRQPPETIRLVQVAPETQPQGTTQPAEPTLKPEPYLPPPETIKLALAEQDGTVYAMREGSPTVYSVRREVFDALLAEYRAKALFRFDASQVTAVTVNGPDGEDGFIKVGDEWQYAAEPDIPIDANKVTNLLNRISGLTAQRYIEYGASDPARSEYGLDEPQYTLTVRTGESETSLLVSSSTCEKVPGQLHYAMLGGTDDVFLVSPDTIRRFTISLDEFEAQ